MIAVVRCHNDGTDAGHALVHGRQHVSDGHCDQHRDACAIKHGGCSITAGADSEDVRGKLTNLMSRL